MSERTAHISEHINRLHETFLPATDDDQGTLLDLQPELRLYAVAVSTYTIGEVADASGFSASALRYYEGIGLVVPASRTASGYRLYDDAALTRLAFIARAKHLGCTLDEITDLVAVWDGTCEPVQKRFHELVTTKLAETQRQIAELRALHSQLRDAAAQLASPALDGVCAGKCACIRSGVSERTDTIKRKERQPA